MSLRIIRAAFSPTGASVFRLRSGTLSTRSIRICLNRYTALSSEITLRASNNCQYLPQRRQLSTGETKVNENKLKSDDDEPMKSIDPVLIYESPFASLTLKLKRVSLTSAAIGLVGLPILSVFYGAGDVPATGQLAVIVTAGVTAVGSTCLLGYCFTPYVHTMERLDNSQEGDGQQIRMITRDILARRVETIFNPDTDVTPPPGNNTRPFCNFMIHNKPYYIHPDLVQDYKVRVKLVGEGEKIVEEVKKKTDDDEFL